MRHKNLNISAIAAGLVAVLVGFASSVAIVFQAAAAAGASAEIAASWLIALGIGMGLTCIGLSWYYKAPVLTAWSTPGAALLATSLYGFSINEAVAVFMFSALLGLIAGCTGWFDKLLRLLPLPVASAMLAGILLQFGLNIFSSLQQQFTLVAIMCLIYLLSRCFMPRYSILLVLAAGILSALLLDQLSFSDIHFELVKPIFIWPQWSTGAVIGVGLPLFIVTMASQNIPGVAVLRSSGYQTPVSPLISWTSLTTLLLAPFGAFSINLAAITAAICSGEEAHPNPAKRYIAGIAAGVFYLLTALAAGAVVTIFAAFPNEMVAALAGLALLGTIGSNLATATADTRYREAAVVTFLVTASGVSFWHIAAPFWGLLAGSLTLLLLNGLNQKKSG